jgi:uncharacterized DUF497 family protein
MPWYDFLGSYEADGNHEHIAEHGISPDEVEWVVQHPLEVGSSRSSGRPVAVGRTPEGRLLIVVYEQIDDLTIYPVTAYEVEGA